MKNPIYKIIELTGTSAVSTEEAVANVIERAHATIKNLRWFQILETRGDPEKREVDHWRVTIKFGFEVEG